MQPFTLDPESIQESFKENYSKEDWPAGNFDYNLKLSSTDLLQTEKDTLCEWLAHNCTNNFIVFEESNERLAGGSSNNLLDWNNRKRRGIYKKLDKLSTITVRLSKEDILMFRMVWIT